MTLPSNILDHDVFKSQYKGVQKSISVWDMNVVIGEITKTPLMTEELINELNQYCDYHWDTEFDAKITPGIIVKVKQIINGIRNAENLKTIAAPGAVHIKYTNNFDELKVLVAVKSDTVEILVKGMKKPFFISLHHNQLDSVIYILNSVHDQASPFGIVDTYSSEK